MPRIPKRTRSEFLSDSLTALCGGALALNLLLVVALLVVLAGNGLAAFWQPDLTRIERTDGSSLLGEVRDREEILDAASRDDGSAAQRILVRTANRDLTGTDFEWVDESTIVTSSRPADALLLERLEWGRFHGFLKSVRLGDDRQFAGKEAWNRLGKLLSAKRTERQRIESFESGEIGDLNRELESLRLELRRVELRGNQDTAARARIEAAMAISAQKFEEASGRLFAMRSALVQDVVEVETADGEIRTFPIGTLVRAIRPNELGIAGKLRLYGSRLWEFVSADPRESNTEGGIFPAIFGTVMMVFLMSAVVGPFGVVAAVYLREYATQGTVVRIVRIAVNNLAGVPSIVFGVFGLGFFVYVCGGTIDSLFFPEALPSPTFGTGGIFWASLTLALLTVPVVIVATEEGLASVPRIVREGSLALGATKFETTFKVVVPAAAPGILTGLILAMARAAGEVAPLMIVGMVKLAATLPVDGNYPYIHLERKFMHLGFHIYDVGFQSPNVEATKPLVFATALLLILVVTTMNLVAISVRTHLRNKYRTSAV